MSTSSIALVCGTDIGLLRSRNEDNVAIWPEHSLAILADGIGGNNAGQLASKVAVDATYENWINTVANMSGTGSGFSGSVSGDLLMVAVSIANHQIHDLVKAEADLDGMGSTIIACHFGDDAVHVVHLGDSRLYQLRDGMLTQMTVDHTFAQRSYELGEIKETEINTYPGGNFLLKSLGADLAIEPDVLEIQQQQSDLYLLCSDGLSDMLEPNEITTTLTENSTNLETAVQALIDQANANGGRDNIAIALARYPSA